MHSYLELCSGSVYSRAYCLNSVLQNYTANRMTDLVPRHLYKPVYILYLLPKIYHFIFSSCLINKLALAAKLRSQIIRLIILGKIASFYRNIKFQIYYFGCTAGTFMHGIVYFPYLLRCLPQSYGWDGAWCIRRYQQMPGHPPTNMACLVKYFKPLRNGLKRTKISWIKSSFKLYKFVKKIFLKSL